MSVNFEISKFAFHFKTDSTYIFYCLNHNRILKKDISVIVDNNDQLS